MEWLMGLACGGEMTFYRKNRLKKDILKEILKHII